MVATMLLIGLAALSTAAALLYLMFSMMCAFFVLSALLATNSISNLTVRRESSRVWQAGVPYRVSLKIRNGKLFSPSHSLRLQDFLADGTLMGAAFFDVVGPKGTLARRDYECVFLRRGVYRFARLVLATRFPFGLIERVLSFDRPGEVLVLPQSIKVDERMAEARADLGDFQSQRRGMGTGLYGLREYTPELSARDIHWKVSARRGRLMVREYESEERRRAIVILDNRRPEEDVAGFEEAFERAVILAASVIEWLCLSEHEVELRTASGIVGFGTGLAHLNRCRRSLARLPVIPHAEGDEHLLRGGEEGVVLFPILAGPPAAAQPGWHPLSILEFEGELAAALGSGPEAPP